MKLFNTKDKQIRPGQRELMQDYLNKVEKSTDKELELHNIIKKEQRTFFKIIDTLFLIIILSGLIWGWTHGAYQKTNIVVDCKGEIMQLNNEAYYGNLTLEDFGFERIQEETDNDGNKPTR